MQYWDIQVYMNKHMHAPTYIGAQLILYVLFTWCSEIYMENIYVHAHIINTCALYMDIIYIICIYEYREHIKNRKDIALLHRV